MEAFAADRNISVSELARHIGVHRHTLSNQLSLNGIPPPSQYSTIPDDDLDRLLKAYRELRPSSGIRYATGFLRTNGLRVPVARVTESLRRIDGLRQVIRNYHTLDRRIYAVPHSNYLWHIDGHHKLIRWGFVIHGGADGYDRAVGYNIFSF